MLGSLSQLHYQLVKVVAIIVVLAVSTMQECDLFARRINFTSYTYGGNPRSDRRQRFNQHFASHFCNGYPGLDMD